MGHRKGSGRSSVYSTHGRRGTSIVGHPTSSPHRPLSHSSPLRQPSRLPRKIQWGNAGSRSNYSLNDRPSPSRCGSRETGTLTWGENFSNVSKSPNSLSLGSDGGSSVSSANSASSKYNNTGGNKKPVARPSNPLRYKTELCRSFEENGECRFGTSCTFAHGLRELRAVLRHPRYKTDLCRTYHGAGYCQYGARCHFIHDPEEAAGVAAMRGHKLRIRPDGADMAMLALSENCNLASRMYANDLILANLRHLHAYKAMEKKIGLNTSGYGSEHLDSIGTLSPQSNSMSFDMLTIGQDTFSGMTLMSQPQGNFLGTSLDTSEPNSVEYSVGAESCSSSSRDSQVWKLSSLDWDREQEIITRNPVPDLDAVSFSCAPRSDTWHIGEVPTQNKAVIGNPMEVSRSLLIPSITELIQMQ